MLGGCRSIAPQGRELPTVTPTLTPLFFARFA
jgi:hypothetical protein